MEKFSKHKIIYIGLLFLLGVFGRLLFVISNSNALSKRASAMVTTHLGQQGLVVGSSGVASLYISVMESDNDFCISSLTLKRSQKIYIERTFSSRDNCSISNLLRIHHAVKSQILEYEIISDIEFSRFQLFTIIFSGIFLASLSLGMLAFFKWYIKQRFNILTAASQAQLAAQVSHDIRSPLSALNMILSQLDILPEQSRVLVRSSVNRITDIANSLLNHNKKQSSDTNTSSTQLENTMLASLIDSLVSEKRIALREKANIQIEARLDKSYGLFSKIKPMEMKRLLSNAITNAAEAFDTNQGQIEVILDSNENNIILTVKDNGKGIPPHILAKLGSQGVTYGKDGTQSGSGLGVYHAKKTIESFEGKYEIQSSVGIGTSIVMTLKKETPPDWFVQKLSVKKGQTVVATDDDSSILEIWKQRLAGLIIENDINLVTCTSGTCLRDWMAKQPDAAKDAIYLMDYELLGQKQTGLDLIEELGLKNRAILVSSRYDEAPIKERCAKLGVKLIPKGMASLVPIELEKEKQKLDAVLIDDDTELIHSCWKFAAKDKNKNILCFADEEAFLTAVKDIDFLTPIYVDVNLKNGIRGQDVATRVHALGFTNINLATGYAADSVERPGFIQNVTGKDFPL
jgi:signal transduction histidine kinase